MPAFERHKTNYPGVFFIEVSSTGSKKSEKIYYVRYRRDSKLIEEKVGRQYQDDMTPAKAARIRTNRIEGNNTSNREHRLILENEKLTQTTKWTIDRLFLVFEENKSLLKSLKDDRIRYHKHLQKALGDKTPPEVVSEDVDRIRRSLLRTHKPATVKQVLVLLKRIINMGIRKGLCEGLRFQIEMPKVNNLSTEDLSPERLFQLLTAIDADHDFNAKDMMRLALYTGMRRGEMFLLEWDHIDFDKGFIHIRNPKGGSDQVIPMNDAARSVLENHPHNKSQYVFPGQGGKRMTDNRASINRIKEKAGLPKDFRPLHGLRHVFASMLASSGQVDMYTLQKLLTHKSPQMTQRYAHLRDETLKQASNLMGELVEQAINTEKKVVKAG